MKKGPLLLLLCLFLVACSAASPSPTATQAPTAAPTSAPQASSNGCKVVPLVPEPDPELLKVIPPVGADDHVRGNPQGSVTIIEYSDFQ